MLYQFTASCGPTVTYTGEVGEAILRHAGRAPGERGVIVWADIPTLLTRLRAAVATEAEQAPVAVGEADDQEADDRQADDRAPPPSVPLATRLTPFMDLLERAFNAQKDVTWGI